MITKGPNLGLLDGGDYGEDVYLEELRAKRILDLLVQGSVKSIATFQPPANPSDGDAYIIPVGAGEAWLNKTGQIARWTTKIPRQDPQWEYIIPRRNWLMGVDAAGTDGAIYRFNGTAWTLFSGSGGGGETPTTIPLYIPTGEEFVVPENVQMSNYTTVTVDGMLTVDGFIDEEN